MRLTSSVPLTDGSSYEQPEPGRYMLICVGICDLGTMPGGQFKPTPKLLFRFECWRIKRGTAQPSKDSAGNIHTIFSRFTPSLDVKATLRPVVECLLGRDLSDPATLDTTDLLGKVCIGDLQKDKEEKYVNIRSFSRVNVDADGDPPSSSVIRPEHWESSSHLPPPTWACRALEKSLTLADRIPGRSNGHANGNGHHAKVDRGPDRDDDMVPSKVVGSAVQDDDDEAPF